MTDEGYLKASRLAEAVLELATQTGASWEGVVTALETQNILSAAEAADTVQVVRNRLEGTE